MDFQGWRIIHETRGFHSQVERECPETRSIIPERQSPEGMIDLVKGYSKFYEGMLFLG